LPQSRISFTELSEAELPNHSKIFGPFAIEFDIETLRREGALPVIYMPQPLSPADTLALLGVIIVSHLGHIKYTVEQLHHLSQVSDPAQALKLPGSEGATRVADNYTLNLGNVDENGKIVQSAEVPAKSVRDVLNYIGFRNAPFNTMIGVLSLAQSLFYPTDNEHIDEILAYYRQREWRITSGFDVSGKPRACILSDAEKTIVSKIDERFWLREDIVDQTSVKRIDQAAVLNDFQDKSVVDRIKSVFVPPEAVDLARRFFGERVTSLTL
jgi:hypothetical protein